LYPAGVILFVGIFITDN